jgi:hypothetical protein
MLEVLEVGLGVLLVVKFLDQLLLRQHSQSLKVVPELFVAQDSLDCHRKDSDCTNRRQKLHISVVVGH